MSEYKSWDQVQLEERAAAAGHTVEYQRRYEAAKQSKAAEFSAFSSQSFATVPSGDSRPGPEAIWGVKPPAEAVNERDRGRVWLSEQTPGGTLRAFAQPAVLPQEDQRAAEDEADRLVQRRRQAYREACREIPDGVPVETSFDVAHPYQSDAADLAIQLRGETECSVRDVLEGRVMVAAPPGGGSWYSGTTHALQSLLRQVNPFIEMQIGSEPSDRRVELTSMQNLR